MISFRLSYFLFAFIFHTVHIMKILLLEILKSCSTMRGKSLDRSLSHPRFNQYYTTVINDLSEVYKYFIPNSFNNLFFLQLFSSLTYSWWRSTKMCKTYWLNCLFIKLVAATMDSTRTNAWLWYVRFCYESDTLFFFLFVCLFCLLCVSSLQSGTWTRSDQSLRSQGRQFVFRK